MKKTLVALAVLVAAGSVNAAEVFKSDEGSVDFYGQLRQELKKNDDNDATLKSGSSRAGVKVNYKASDDLSVLGLIEFNINDTAAFTTRKHTVGLSGDFGTVTVGKDSILTDDVWGAENSYFYGGTSVLPEADGFGVNWLQQAMVKYVLEAEAGWLKAAYSYDNGDANPTTFEVFAGTSFDAISVYGGFGLITDKTTSTTGYSTTIDPKTGMGTAIKSTKDSEIKHVMLTVSYAADKFDVGATYWHAENENKKVNYTLETDSLVVAGSYKVADKTKVYGGYEFVGDYQAADKDFTNLYAGVEYKLSGWARVYAELALQDDDNKADKENNYGIGARVYW
jgi:outer membrane protein OmpT